LSALDCRWKELKERCRRLRSRIAATPACTVDGMHAKIAFASSFNFREREDLVEGKVDDLLLSAAMDYADNHGQEGAHECRPLIAVLGAAPQAGPRIYPDVSRGR
jgi:hypothetical protein